MLYDDGVVVAMSCLPLLFVFLRVVCSLSSSPFLFLREY